MFLCLISGVSHVCGKEKNYQRIVCCPFWSALSSQCFLLATELNNKVADLLVENISLLPGRSLAVDSHTVLSATGYKEMRERYISIEPLHRWCLYGQSIPRPHKAPALVELGHNGINARLQCFRGDHFPVEVNFRKQRWFLKTFLSASVVVTMALSLTATLPSLIIIRHGPTQRSKCSGF